MVETFVEQYGKEPVVSTIHAGLECGLFLGKKPDLDCVSMGPDLLDIHSFNEKLDIASTQRTWEYLKGILAKLKQDNVVCSIKNLQTSWQFEK